MTDKNHEADSHEKNFKIFVRILPLERPCESCAKIDEENKKIYVRCLQEMKPSRMIATREPSYWCFRTDGILYDSTQEDVYRLVAKDLVQKVLGGVNCVLMGYGQTASGKSFTIGGLRNNWEHRGIVTRLLSSMFAERSNRKRVSKIEYRLSFLELRGKGVTDLLTHEIENRVRLNDRNVFKDVCTAILQDEDDALERIFEGERKRSIVKGSTYPSHTSTSVITFHVSNISLITSWGIVATAKLHIVEMAGTGTVGKTECRKAASDVGNANLTKTQLEQFFSNLAGTREPPFNFKRSSNLLKILGDAFSVTSVIRFVAHVRITREDLEVTLSTLRFGAKIARLKPVKTRKHVTERPEFLVEKLQKEIESLKRELDIHEMFLDQEALSNVSRTRADQINRDVLNFLDGTISDLTLFGVCHTQVLLKTVKELYNKYKAKQIEIDKLEETYEGVLKNLTRDNGSAGSLKDTGKSVSGLNHNRKKSKSSATIIEEAESPPKEQVGTLDKSSVTLGAGIEESEIREAVEVDKYSRLPKQIRECNDQDGKMTRKAQDLFDRFLKEEKVYASLMERMADNENNLASMRQKFSILMDKYSQVNVKLAKARAELLKHQKNRYFVDKEEYDDKGSVIIPEVEKLLVRDVLCYQKAMTNLEGQVSQMQKDIWDLVDSQAATKSKLELAFDEFRRKTDILSSCDLGTTKLQLDPLKRESLEEVRRKFNRLQKRMNQRNCKQNTY